MADRASSSDPPNEVPFSNSHVTTLVHEARGGIQEPNHEQQIVDIESGEIQTSMSEFTPIRDTMPQMYPIMDTSDISLEDDEMLQLQLQMAENRDQILARKIELKRRRVQNESSSSKPFNLSRELSREIERAGYADAADRVRKLEEEKEQYET